MKIKQTLSALSFAALLAPQMVSAHSTIIEKEIIEGERTYLTIQVPHGCGDNPTKKIMVRMPNSQEDHDAGWAFTEIQPVVAWYPVRAKSDKIFTATGEISEEVSSIHIFGIHVPSHYVFKAEFRGRAPMLPDGVESKELYFDIIQKCTRNTVSEWSVANDKPAVVTVVKAPAGHAGGH